MGLQMQMENVKRLRKLNEQPLAHVSKLARFVAEDRYLPADARQRLSERILKLAEGNVVLEQTVDSAELALQALGPEIAKAEAKGAGAAAGAADGAGASSTDTKPGMFAEKLKEGTKKELERMSGSIQQHGHYKTVSALVQPSDDDIQMTHVEGDASFKCSLTQAFFVHPVKIRGCGHTFEGTAIENHIKINSKGGKPPGPLCPQCNAKIKLSDLAPDLEKQLDMVQHRKQTQSQQEQAAEEEEEGGDSQTGFTYVD